MKYELPIKILPLKERLLTFFLVNKGVWFPSAVLEIKVRSNPATSYTGSTTTRCLRKMAEEGLIDRKLVDNHANYRLHEDPIQETLF